MAPELPEPQVLYEDDNLLVVDKPSGLAVHRGWARDRFVLVDWVRDASGQATAYPVGRLDRGTSGVVLFARTPEGAQQLQLVMARPDTVKTYLALVRGKSPAEGTIDHPVPRVPNGDRVDALTTFRTLCTLPTEPRHLSLVEATIFTGRLHQIRRHLKHINHPIIGDSNYGRTDLNRAIQERYGLARMALHARSITLIHPSTKQTLTIVAPTPKDLTLPLLQMGLPPHLL